MSTLSFDTRNNPRICQALIEEYQAGKTKAIELIHHYGVSVFESSGTFVKSGYVLALELVIISVEAGESIEELSIKLELWYREYLAEREKL